MNEVEVNGKLISFEAFTKLDKSTILTFNAMGCTSLVSLGLPAATEVDVEMCTSLVSLNLPVATKVNAMGCTGLSTDMLTSLKVQCGENLLLDTLNDASQVGFHA